MTSKISIQCILKAPTNPSGFPSGAEWLICHVLVHRGLDNVQDFTVHYLLNQMPHPTGLPNVPSDVMSPVTDV